MFFKEKQPTKPETIITTLSTFSLCYVFLSNMGLKTESSKFQPQSQHFEISNQLSNQ